MGLRSRGKERGEEQHCARRPLAGWEIRRAPFEKAMCVSEVGKIVTCERPWRIHGDYPQHSQCRWDFSDGQYPTLVEVAMT